MEAELLEVQQRETTLTTKLDESLHQLSTIKAQPAPAPLRQPEIEALQAQLTRTKKELVEWKQSAGKLITQAHEEEAEKVVQLQQALADAESFAKMREEELGAKLEKALTEAGSSRSDEAARRETLTKSHVESTRQLVSDFEARLQQKDEALKDSAEREGKLAGELSTAKRAAIEAETTAQRAEKTLGKLKSDLAAREEALEKQNRENIAEVRKTVADYKVKVKALEETERILKAQLAAKAIEYQLSGGEVKIETKCSHELDGEHCSSCGKLYKTEELFTCQQCRPKYVIGVVGSGVLKMSSS